MDFVEFSHRCILFDSSIDSSLPPSHRLPDGKIILDTKCDIQANEKPIETKDGVIDADYIVYIPVMKIPRIQKDSKIELFYNSIDIRYGVVRQYESSMMLGNRIWVKEISN